MKKQMQMLITVFAVCGAVAVATAADRFEQEVTVAAGATSGTATFNTFRGYGGPASTIDTVFATATSGSGTGTVVFAQYDYGVATTLSTVTDVRYGVSAYDRPLCITRSLVTYPVVQNVVTGNVVLAVSNLQTNYAVTATSYLTRQCKVTITQGAVADATVYKVLVYVKEDPPVKP